MHPTLRTPAVRTQDALAPASLWAPGRNRFLMGLVLVILSFAAYSPALRGQFLWDDDRYIQDNAMLRSGEGLVKIWTQLGTTPQYYPLTHTTFWLEYHLWGLNTTGYHAVNMLLHGLSAILIWLILLRLQIPGAWVIAAIFAVHPLQAESVAWMTERKNTLAGFFFFSSILAYLRLARITPPSRWAGPEASDDTATNSTHWRWYILSLVLFCLAGLSKTIAVSAPAIILLLLWYKRRSAWRHIALLLPMFVVGLVLSRITSWMEVHTVGAVGADWMHTPAERILIAGHALWFYAGKIFWPLNLIFIYPRWVLNTASLAQWLWPISALLVVIALVILARWRRGPLVAVLYFAVTLAPALGFVDVFPMRASYVADHFQYLSGLGLIALAIALLYRLLQYLGQITSMTLTRIIAATLVGAILLSLTGLSWARSHVYDEHIKLWQDTYAKNPDAWLASFNLAVLLSNRAVSEQKMAQVADSQPEQQRELRRSMMADRETAQQLLERTIALRPTMSRAHLILGELLAIKNQLQPALQQLDLAVQYDPDWYSNYRTRAKIHEHLGDTDAAIADYQRAIDAYQRARRKAIDQPGSFYAARLMHPAYAWPHVELGILLTRESRLDEAMTQFNDALVIRPGWVEALRQRGLLYARMHKFDQASADLMEVIRQNPTNAATWISLAYVRYQAGHTSDAIAFFRHALQLSPNAAEARVGLDMATRAHKSPASQPAPATTPIIP